VRKIKGQKGTKIGSGQLHKDGDRKLRSEVWWSFVMGKRRRVKVKVEEVCIA
jgi:hypothetical protein